MSVIRLNFDMDMEAVRKPPLKNTPVSLHNRLLASVAGPFLAACCTLLPVLWAHADTRAASGAVPRTLVYPRSEEEEDRRDDYPVQLLALALSKAGRQDGLLPHALFMLQARSIRELEQGRWLDVIWTMTSTEREAALLPIRIPIDRGLLGWRLLLVRASELPRLAQVRGLVDLQALRAGQGADWPDTTILRAAGLNVDESARYGDLFRKLGAGRIDYFPRGLQEIWSELDQHRSEGLAAEPRLALHYPTAMYFFVNKRDTALAADITRGLERALRDGSFDALFQRHFGAQIKRAGLNERQVIELRNPLLPAQTPLADARLWYRP